MRFEVSRLRRGEVIAGAAALLLLVDLFLLPWFDVLNGVTTVRVNGWDALAIIRWLILLSGAVGLALTYSQGARRGPALPATLSVIATVLGAVTTLALAWRALVSNPGIYGLSTSAAVGAYLGLVGALALTAGAFASLRKEDRPDPARNAAIETVHLD